MEILLFLGVVAFFFGGGGKGESSNTNEDRFDKMRREDPAEYNRRKWESERVADTRYQR